jgi:CheY-like chemotaxis protein
MIGLCVLAVGANDETRLVDFAGSARIVRVPDLQAAAAHLADGSPAVDLIVCVQSRPGEFSDAAIDALRRLAPLARVWRLLGSWCEGEQRSGRPPSGCTHTYWHQWRQRAARDFAAARAGRCPLWGLPPTATADERGLAIAQTPVEKRTGLIVVCAQRAETASALAEACRPAGFSTTVVVGDQPFAAGGATALLWDTSVEEACEVRRVERLRSAAGGAPLLALVGFPRPDDCRRAMAAGVTAVISKPFLVPDLLGYLAESQVACGSSPVR